MNGEFSGHAENVPKYLQPVFARLGENDIDIKIDIDTNTAPSLEEIKRLSNRQLRTAGLLLARHVITRQLAAIDCVGGDGDGRGNGRGGLCPELILQRAVVYEALGYSELALADAYVSYTLCEVVLEGGDVSDLEPVTVEGEDWPAVVACSTGNGDAEGEGEDGDGDGDEGEIDRERTQLALRHKYRSLILLARSALILGCQHQAKIWIDELLSLEVEVSLEEKTGDFCNFWSVDDGEGGGLAGIGMFRAAVGQIRRNYSMGDKRNLFGSSSRVVYPWNEHEPDRMSKESLDEINAHLRMAAPDLEVEISVLPNLVVPKNTATNTSTTTSTWVEGADADIDTDTGETETKTPAGAEGSSQLGLYAKKDLAPGATILEERSVLSAIRPHGEALCDACAADMEAIPQEARRHCPACNIPFCSEACYDLATTTYHAVNEEDEETDEGYPPYETPFCPGSSGNEDLHTLGRAESSTTPEWDLYFLLLSRTMQMAETQRFHPLDLFEVKYLWGDFSPAPGAHGSMDLVTSGGKENENENENENRGASGRMPSRTLPYSVRHHVELPLQWFEVLMHSRPECRPYSKHWLEKYDWWIVQTLFAKFRGVADAQQSTWTGKPEVAAVHPLWCLANHSCDPNVTWKSSGVRDLTVVSERVQWRRSRTEGGEKGEEERGEGEGEWKGIKAGEEIWNHYTDIHETDFRERRARLNAVLGGECRCERCSAEEAMAMVR
ncbi:hypothetical protein LTR47_005846 [Exophiala xenobiotica]|nr:hypothetical protein LTR47_005846 [Exophiala xenobiotica]KAK5258198.1 hypothetical protein LTR40_008382 [Exophiala xenobiotica]KAK5322450.1 hypothetical protein LTR93_005653 [Exophiala xenobiotica]KAK5350976.1 hypothetical protein LTR61_005329 [Exophiala xenobiotica]KAK5373956.1 hypothetical protein LTS03_006111 [Exophiala xenobiotica]